MSGSEADLFDGSGVDGAIRGYLGLTASHKYLPFCRLHAALTFLIYQEQLLGRECEGDLLARPWWQSDAFKTAQNQAGQRLVGGCAHGPEIEFDHLLTGTLAGVAYRGRDRDRLAGSDGSIQVAVLELRVAEAV